MNEQEYIKQIINFLKDNLKNSIKSEDVAIAFSGGVDSCILAELLKQLGIKQTAYVVGVEGCKDFDSAEKAAAEIGLKLEKIKLTKEDIKENLSIQIKIIQDIYRNYKNELESESHPLKADPVSVSFNLPLFFVAKYSKEKQIVMGQGADTLFGGFVKYLEMARGDAVKKINKDTRDLVEIGCMQHKNTSQYFDKEVVMPFLDAKVVEVALSLPYELKINKINKYILRKLSKEIGLSDEISFKAKKSAQYGSGIMKILKKLAKDEKTTVREYIEKLTSENK